MSDSEGKTRNLSDKEELIIEDKEQDASQPMKPYSKRLQNIREDLLKKLDRSRLLQNFLATEEKAVRREKFAQPSIADKISKGIFSTGLDDPEDVELKKKQQEAQRKRDKFINTLLENESANRPDPKSKNLFDA